MTKVMTTALLALLLGATAASAGRYPNYNYDFGNVSRSSTLTGGPSGGPNQSGGG